MSGPTIAALIATGVVVAGCSLAEALAPSQDVANVTIVLPSTILAGDTVRARAIATRDNGKPAGDTTVTWNSSDASAVAVDAAGRVSGSVVGQHAAISATVGKITSSVNVTIGDDQRLGYALADQPTAAGPYSPDANYRFNSSGGGIDLTRASTGVYSVRFAGLGRTSGQRDNVLVTGYGGAAGIYCKLGGWQSTGSDLVAEVRCFSPTACSGQVSSG